MSMIQTFIENIDNKQAPMIIRLRGLSWILSAGNTSASTTWYSFSYLETCVGLKQGQRLMQIGCGGGMKVSGQYSEQAQEFITA